MGEPSDPAVYVWRDHRPYSCQMLYLGRRWRRVRRKSGNVVWDRRWPFARAHFWLAQSPIHGVEKIQYGRDGTRFSNDDRLHEVMVVDPDGAVIRLKGRG